MSAAAVVRGNVNVLLFPSLLYFLLIFLQRGSKMKDHIISFLFVERNSAKQQKVLNKNENDREETEQELGKRRVGK